MSRTVRKGGAVPSTVINQRAVDFRQQLDTHTRTLVDSFGWLIRSAKITNPQNTTREELQINVATASLATAGEGLLRQVREVKLAVMLQDEAAMDCEVDQALSEIAQERAHLEKELQALSNELKAAYAKASMAGGEAEEEEMAPKEKTAPEAGVPDVSSSTCAMEVATAAEGHVKLEVKEEVKEGGDAKGR